MLDDDIAEARVHGWSDAAPVLRTLSTDLAPLCPVVASLDEKLILAEPYTIPSQNDLESLPPFRAMMFAARAAEHARAFYACIEDGNRTWLNEDELVRIDRAICLAKEIASDSASLSKQRGHAYAAACVVQAIHGYEADSCKFDFDPVRFTRDGTQKFDEDRVLSPEEREYLGRLLRSAVSGAAYYAAMTAANGPDGGTYGIPIARSVGWGAYRSGLMCSIAASLVSRLEMAQDQRLIDALARSLMDDFFRLLKLDLDFTQPGFFTPLLRQGSAIREFGSRSGVASLDLPNELKDALALGLPHERSRETGNSPSRPAFNEALERFKRSCNQFQYTVRTEYEQWLEVMKRAQDVVWCWWNIIYDDELEKKELWQLAGCRVDPTIPDTERSDEDDMRLVRYLVRIHQRWNEEDLTRSAETSEAFALYLFGYFLTHHKHPGNAKRFGRPENYYDGIEITPLQNMALAIFFEAHGCKPDPFILALKDARLQGWFPRDIDDDSQPMRMVLSRTWVSHKILDRWLERRREQLGAE